MHHDMKTYGGWYYRSTVIETGTRHKWVVTFTPLSL
jgi:hypothetical protein